MCPKKVKDMLPIFNVILNQWSYTKYSYTMGFSQSIVMLLCLKAHSS